MLRAVCDASEVAYAAFLPGGELQGVMVQSFTDGELAGMAANQFSSTERKPSLLLGLSPPSACAPAARLAFVPTSRLAFAPKPPDWPSSPTLSNEFYTSQAR